MKIIYMLILSCWALSVNAKQHQDPEIRAKVVVKTSHSWDGSQLPSYATGQPEVTILKIIIPAGVTLPLHQHPYINAGVLLKGELTVHTQAGDELVMGPGDPIVEVVNKWHLGKNTGKTDAEIMVFYAGIKGQPITIKQDLQRE